MPENPYQPPDANTRQPRQGFPIWAIVAVVFAVLLPCGLSVIGAATWFLFHSRAAFEAQRIEIQPPRVVPAPPPAPLPMPPRPDEPMLPLRPAPR